MAISPTAEGFRVAFRRPALTLAEISWRWVFGATAVGLFFFGLFEYLNTLPVSNRELLFLRSRHPYLIAQAIAHVLRGNMSRAVISAVLAVLLLSLFWIIVASLGRIATVRALLDYFRKDVPPNTAGDDARHPDKDLEGSAHGESFPSLLRLNFLRTSIALATIVGFFGAAILAGLVSPDRHPRPGLAFLFFLPLAALNCLVWSSLNWLLSLAGIFAVRDGKEVMGAISAAVTFCRERTGAVVAVSTWTGLAHLVAFVGATTIVSVPLGFAGLLPWRLVVLCMILLTLAYFILADWLYMARLAGYVCIAETPEALLKPVVPSPPVSSLVSPAILATSAVDRDELILSDVPISPATEPGF